MTICASGNVDRPRRARPRARELGSRPRSCELAGPPYLAAGIARGRSPPVGDAVGLDPAVDLAAGAREVPGERAHAATELLERGDELVARRHGRPRARRQVELGVARALE